MTMTVNSAAAANPQAASALFKQAIELQNVGRHLEASLRYEYLLQMQPNNWQARYNYGFALQALGRFADAGREYEAVTRMQPALAEAYVNRGNIFLRLQQPADALGCYEKAIALKPELATAHYNQSLALRRLSRFSESIAPLRRTVALEPSHNTAWDELCLLLMALKRLEESIQVFLQWEEHVPASPELTITGLRLARYLGGEARESKYLQQILDWPFPPATPAQAKAILGLIAYFDIGFDQQLALYQRYQSAVAAAIPAQTLYFPKRLRGEKIRLGYVSADFRKHVMGRLMREIITRHDRNQFEIHLFALHEPVHDDDTTQVFKSQADLYLNISTLPAEKMAQTIAGCDLDLLIDLAGHTDVSKPELYRYKPARVIATHMAYHGCIGLAEVDYKITDHYADRSENRAYQIENLLPMEGCLFPFSHVDPIADIGTSREELGLNGKFVFATFVNLQKLSPRCLKSWKAILDQAPHAMLAFSPIDSGEKQSVHRLLGGAGIDTSRLVFLPASKDDAQMRARYRLTDAILDTFPYCGGDTTLAALDMDMPVVTLVGERHGERIGLSILSNLGVTETIAANDAGYIELAVKLATDKTWYRTVREKIVAVKAGSILCNTDQYVRNLEAAYCRALQEKNVALTSDCHLSPQEFSLKFQQALTAHQNEDRAQAQQLYQELSSEQPDYAPLNYLYGSLMREGGDRDQAVALLSRAAANAPAHVDARVALGNLYLDLQRYPAAVDVFQQAVALQPGHAEAWGGLGLALLQEGRAAEAVEPLAKAQQSKPADAQLAFNFAVALHRAGGLREAAEAYSRSLSLNPNDVEAAYNFGLLLASQEQWQPAEELFQRVLVHAPAHAEAYCRLHDVLAASGKIDALLANQQVFEKHCPTDPRQKLGQLDRYRYGGNLASEARVMQELIQTALTLENESTAEALLARLLDRLPYYDIAPDDQQHLVQRYNRASKKHEADAQQLAPSKPDHEAGLREAGGGGAALARLRIGYLSADFVDSPAGQLLHALLMQHDPDKVELYGYTLTSRQDDLTRAVGKLTKRMALVGDLDAIDAAQLIAEDRLDILVDVCGVGTPAVFAILAAKPARIIVSHPLAMHAYHLDVIDYRLTDQKIDLVHQREFPAEKLLAVAGCAYPFRRISAEPPAALPKRKKFGIADNAVVLAAFGPWQALSQRCLLLWQQILQRLPEAVLLFAPRHASEHVYYKRLMKAAGIKEEQIRFAPLPKNDSEAMGLYRLVDVVLDPLPCGNALGVIDAINAAVPVVTLIGQRDSERMVPALLQHLNVPDTVANSGPEYVDMAVKLARDADFKAAIQSKMQHGSAAASAWVATGEQIKELEAAYARMIQLAADRQPA